MKRNLFSTVRIVSAIIAVALVSAGAIRAQTVDGSTTPDAPLPASTVEASPAGPATEVPLTLPTTDPAAGAPPISLPPAVRLEGLRPVYQQYNRCSSAALTIHLSYFGWTGTYDNAISGLNPHPEDVAVRLDELIAFAGAQGLRGIERYGGTVDMLRALVAGGFPVLVENVYFDGPDAFGDWMSHNRVVMGYDDATQNLYVFDSLLGNGDDGRGRPIPYAEMDSRWRPFNRGYVVLYRPEQEAQVQQILGAHWDPIYNALYSLSLSEAELAENRADSFTMFNLGSSFMMLDRPVEAAQAFDQARNTGLPFRMMWYQYGPFEAYLATQRYDDVLTLARSVIETTPGVEEAYYYAGLAYEAQGDMVRAQSNFQVALQRNIGFADAQAALNRVSAQTS